MLIVRMETRTGVGVYRSEVDWPEGLYPGDTDRHPSPMWDRGLSEWWVGLSCRAAKRYHFAFKDPTQAKAWFYSNAHIEAMKAAGVGAGIYWVDDSYVQEGWAQVVFIKSESRRIAWYEDIEEGLAAYEGHAAEQGQEV